MQTRMSIATPPKIADAGGYACGSGWSGNPHPGQAISKWLGSYQANIIGKHSRERTQDIHRRLDDFHQCFVTFPKLSKNLGLLLKDVKDVTGRPA
jgi:hypothetical protein